MKGVCHGGTLIDKDLVIEGVKTARTGQPRLSGDGKVRVVMITSRGVRVKLRSLEILRGRSPAGGGILVGRRRGYRDGATWHYPARVVLHDVVVRDNHASVAGGGVYNAGTLLLTGSTRIHDNDALLGGGVRNDMGTLLLRDGSRIDGNDARGEGGGVYTGHIVGGVTLDGLSTISGNTAGASGGGIYSVGHTVMLKDGSSISNNFARGEGGGVYMSGGHLALNDGSSITRNDAEAGGGGIAGPGTYDAVICAPTDGANVHGNVPDDCLGFP